MVERLLVDDALLSRVEEQRLDLRREHEPVVVDAVVERLDPDAVAHEPERARPAVPQREREHPAEAVETVAPHSSNAWTTTSVSSGRCETCGPEPLELRPQLGVVVDLAVEDELDRPVFVRHRLVGAVREVDDREPARAEADSPVGRDPGAGAVGTAMGERVAHPRDATAPRRRNRPRRGLPLSRTRQDAVTGSPTIAARTIRGALAGASVPQRDWPARLAVLEQPGNVGDSLRAQTEHGVRPELDRHRALGRVAKREARDAERGRLLLDAARVGEDETRVSLEPEEVEVAERLGAQDDARARDRSAEPCCGETLDAFADAPERRAAVTRRGRSSASHRLGEKRSARRRAPAGAASRVRTRPASVRTLPRLAGARASSTCSKQRVDHRVPDEVDAARDDSLGVQVVDRALASGRGGRSSRDR